VIVVGIDPGASGAVALIGAFTLHVVDLPTTLDGKATVLDARELYKWITPDCTVALEQLGAHASPSKTAVWSLGRNVGALEAVVALAGCPLVRVQPKAWQATFGLGGPFASPADRKRAHIARARELFPALAEKLIASKDGRADALLIAEHARRLLVGRVAA
jgi:hypothetical protein